MPEAFVLETQALRKQFGGLVAVDDVVLRVRAGSFHAIIGPNGAGKTTLFNLLSRTLDPTSGRIMFKGRDITRLPLHRTAHLGIGRSFQITNVFPNLSVLENVRLAAQAVGSGSFRFWEDHRRLRAALERAHEVLALVGLEPRAALPARALPQGDQRKLELGMILAPDPALLLLDEPTAGMAGEQVPELMELIGGVQRSGGKTVVLVEHNMNVVMRASDYITVMHQGATLAEGTPAEIAANKAVQSAYLGELYGDLGQGAAEEAA